ncbi:MAG: pilus assembly PilX family protein [Desulfobacteria bacterium]
MSAILSIYKSEKGIVLVTGLIVLAILGLLGATAVLTTTTDLQIQGNRKTGEQAFCAAEAGIEEARTRLVGSATVWIGDPAANPDSQWSAYILTSDSSPVSDDPDYDSSYTNYIPTSSSPINETIAANSLQTNASYRVKLRHKREYDAEQAGHTTSSPHYLDGDENTGTHSANTPGSIVYYGYGDPGDSTRAVQFTKVGLTSYGPVEIIRGYGRSGTAFKVVEIEVVYDPGPPITAPLYAGGDVTLNGNAINVDGNDNCGRSVAVLPPIYAMDPATITLNATTGLTPDTPGAVTGSIDLDIQTFMQMYRGMADVTLTSDQNGVDFGSTGNYVTVYSNPSDPPNVQGLSISNGTGYGLLLVEGNLTMGGGFSWNGLILVTGTITLNGGGGPNAINIIGAIMGQQIMDVNGGVNITHGSCEVRNALSNQSLQVISWRDTSIVDPLS